MLFYVSHRYILGWTRPSKFSLLKSVRNAVFRNASGTIADPILQDYMVKLEDLNDFIEYAHQEFKCYPLWLCPVRSDLDHIFSEEIRQLGSETLTSSVIVDVGIYG